MDTLSSELAARSACHYTLTRYVCHLDSVELLAVDRMTHSPDHSTDLVESIKETIVPLVNIIIVHDWNGVNIQSLQTNLIVGAQQID